MMIKRRIEETKMDTKYFSVPINLEGIEALENGEDSFYIHDYEMSGEDFKKMQASGLLDRIRNECEVDLQDGKACEIPFVATDAILNLLKGTEFENSEFAAALLDAFYFLSGVNCEL